MIKVLIVDDSAVMRAFLSGVVNGQPDMNVVATAADPVVRRVVTAVTRRMLVTFAAGPAGRTHPARDTARTR